MHVQEKVNNITTVSDICRKMDGDSSSYLTLQNSYELAGSWRRTWFDSSRQQMLLFDGIAYWLWAPWVTVGWDKPVFYYKNKKLPEQVSFARVSLDSHLLAIQVSPTSIIVVDISSDRQWQLDIKSGSDNEVIQHGIIWSEHGGNSQDLIVLTTRGVELWKVSPARGQCRLSRFISARVKGFWYEPNFRTILIANYQQSSRLNLHKQTVDLSGYILNFDIAEGPKLELPPPDKIPAFSVGPGIKPEEIYLTSLYGNLYCAVYTSSEINSVVKLYLLSKQSVSLKYSLRANISGPISFSTLDNLLCCHYFDFNVSVFYDILDPRYAEISIDTSEFETVDQTCRVGEPFCPASPITYTEFNTSFGDTRNNAPRRISHTNNLSASIWDAVDSKDTVHTSVCDMASSEILRLSIDEAKQSEKNLQPAAGVSEERSDPDECNSIIKIKQLSDLRFLPNGSLIIDKTNTVWKVKCELKIIAATIKPHWRCIDFLSRRGQAPSGPKPISGPDHDIGGEAKEILLAHIRDAVESKACLENLRLVMQPVARAYTIEYLRLHKNDNQINSINVDNNSESGIMSENKIQSESKVKIWHGSFEQRSTVTSRRSQHVVDEQKIRYSISGLDPSRRIFEPLEPPVSPHLLRFEICAALRVDSTFRDRAVSKDFVSVTGRDNVKASPGQPDLLVPINIRRCSDGRLIVSQMEMLCHVWIPLLKLWYDSDLIYFSRALALYIAEIQGASNVVAVESALSLLLFKIFAVRVNHLEAARLMQIQFFSDSVELAVEAFDMASAVDIDNPCVRNSNVCNVLRQSAFDMLWRLGEITTAARRLLDLGLVVDAMSLCTKSRGTWRRGLSPSSISGLDFYKSAILAVRRIEGLKCKIDSIAPSNANKSEKRKCEIFSSLYSFLVEWDIGLFSIYDEEVCCLPLIIYIHINLVIILHSIAGKHF